MSELWQQTVVWNLPNTQPMDRRECFEQAGRRYE